VVHTSLQPLYPLERPGTHCIAAVWAPGPVWTGAENLNRKIMRNFVFKIVIYEISHEISSKFSQFFSIISHFLQKFITVHDVSVTGLTI